MELDKFIRADNLLRDIDKYNNRVRRINEFLGGSYDRVSEIVKKLVNDDCAYSRLDNAVNEELKVYRDRLEKEIEQLKKEFEEL